MARWRCSNHNPCRAKGSGTFAARRKRCEPYTMRTKAILALIGLAAVLVAGVTAFWLRSAAGGPELAPAAARRGGRANGTGDDVWWDRGGV